MKKFMALSYLAISVASYAADKIQPVPVVYLQQLPRVQSPQALQQLVFMSHVPAESQQQPEPADVDDIDLAAIARVISAKDFQALSVDQKQMVDGARNQQSQQRMARFLGQGKAGQRKMKKLAKRSRKAR